MSIQRVNQIFIGAGAALSATNTALNAIAVQTGIVGTDMLSLNPAGTGMTITSDPTIYIVNKLANGDFKRSIPIKGTNVTAWKGQHYAPARRCVWGIGYQRGSIVDGVTTAASGSIIVNNSTFYSADIIFKNDKMFYSERPERLSIEFTSAAAATQSTIADQIVSAINNSGYGNQPSGIKVVKAVKVGDGGGVYGLTGATNFGVEIWGLTINQLADTTYTEEIVYFEVNVNDATGFSTTTCTKIQGFKKGIGTYNEIYNMENFFYGYEGALNRRLWPIPNLPKLTVSTLVSSGSVVAAATTPTGALSAATTAAPIPANTVTYDVVEVATSTAGLRPGEIISLNSVEYEIKYIISTTKFVITTPLTAVVAGTAFLVKYGYNVLNISVTDTTFQDGAGVGQFSPKTVYIATPAIDAAAADPFDRTLDSADTSAECLDLLDILNTWMASTPLAPADVTLA